jgi:hypothetical protein
VLTQALEDFADSSEARLSERRGTPPASGGRTSRTQCAPRSRSRWAMTGEPTVHEVPAPVGAVSAAPALATQSAASSASVGRTGLHPAGAPRRGADRDPVITAADSAAFAESYRGLWVWARHHGLSGFWAAAFPSPPKLLNWSRRRSRGEPQPGSTRFPGRTFDTGLSPLGG